MIRGECENADCVITTTKQEFAMLVTNGSSLSDAMKKKTVRVKGNWLGGKWS